jgi:aldehyde:ferredoxin oxidoreductase
MSIGGAWGKILHVDLSDGRTWVEETPDTLHLLLVGGRALIAYLLLRDLPVGADPLGPDNLLIFAPGIFQGTNFPGAGRHAVGARSPLTGGLASSEAGGWWGHEFKRAGYDALVVRGRAAEPVYLSIRDSALVIRPATHLWGRDTADVDALLKQELRDDKVRVAQCGVAGENGTLFSAVMHDINRAAGRNGLGAVMASKNLKAVAVRGTQSLPVADRKRVLPVSKWLGENYKELCGWAVSMGTPGSVAYLNRVGGLPTRNFQDPSFADAERVSGELMQRTILKERDTCQACPIHCKQVVGFRRDEEEAHLPEWRALGLAAPAESVDVIEPAYGGPEYETLAAFGSNCGVNDLVAVAKANELCARWGLDTISTGMTIAFVMECVERGLLTAERTGGFLPRFGDADGMLAAVDMIAHGRGFGAQMALGSRRLAERIGGTASEFTVEVKGQELALHEPRLKHGLGLGYAVSPVGADHMANLHDTNYTTPGRDLERVSAVHAARPLPANDLSAEKVALFYREVNWQHFQDCAVTCMFYPYDYAQLAEALSGVTGCEYGPVDILAVGERAQQLGRLFNLREGLTEADDRLPKRVMTAFEHGALQGIGISNETLHRARQEWYALMGWSADGTPARERLAALGLADLLR